MKLRHNGSPLFPVVFFYFLIRNSMQFFNRESPQYFLTQVQGLFDASFFIFKLGNKPLLEFLPEFKIIMVQRSKLLFSDHGCEIADILDVAVCREQLTCKMGVVLPGLS